MRRLGFLVSTGLVGVLAGASSAFAGPSQVGYSGNAGGVQGALHASRQGTLPFTGFNLAIIALAGLALVVVGLMLRHRGSNSQA